MNADLRKYPRTPHIEGSGLQQGDEELIVQSFFSLAGQNLVVEEKMDGANSAISFTPDGQVRLQSRGHYLTGGPREMHFHLLKSWVSRFSTELFILLGDRYIMYGEWLYARHTIFYTDLPHYFMEFDILDTHTATFLSTARRRVLLQSAPFIVSVRVLHEGVVDNLTQLQRMVGPSPYIGAHHLDLLRSRCLEQGIDADLAVAESDPSPLMEGLYIKVEDADTVRERYKYVRSDFLQTVIDADSHWLDRPIIPNRLAPWINLYEG